MLQNFSLINPTTDYQDNQDYLVYYAPDGGVSSFVDMSLNTITVSSSGAPVAEPPSGLLFCVGLIGLASIRGRRYAV